MQEGSFMSKCIYCGQDIPEGERYCPVCHAAIPPKYNDRGCSDFTGTYGHTDCWEIDESRYRTDSFAPAHPTPPTASAGFHDPSESAASYKPKTSAVPNQPRPYRPGPQAPSSTPSAPQRSARWESHPEKQPPKENGALGVIAAVTGVLSVVLSFFGGFGLWCLILAAVGYVLNKNGNRKGKSLVLAAFALVLILAIIIVFFTLSAEPYDTLFDLLS